MCVFSLLSLLLIVDSGGTVVLVSQDGIQRPPLRFPKGGHLLQFLSCLENGLLPHGQLDPPLWSQRGKVGSTEGADHTECINRATSSCCNQSLNPKACSSTGNVQMLSRLTKHVLLLGRALVGPL